MDQTPWIKFSNETSEVQKFNHQVPASMSSSSYGEGTPISI